MVHNEKISIQNSYSSSHLLLRYYVQKTLLFKSYKKLKTMKNANIYQDSNKGITTLINQPSEGSKIRNLLTPSTIVRFFNFFLIFNILKFSLTVLFIRSTLNRAYAVKNHLLQQFNFIRFCTELYRKWKTSNNCEDPYFSSSTKSWHHPKTMISLISRNLINK